MCACKLEFEYSLCRLCLTFLSFTYTPSVQSIFSPRWKEWLAVHMELILLFFLMGYACA
jgi:hypothetical protein